MKQFTTNKIVLSLTLAASIFFFSSCIRKKQPLGNAITQNIPVGNFQDVQVDASVAVHFLQGKDFSVKVRGSKDLLPHMHISVKGSTLIIDEKDMPNLSNKIHFDFGDSRDRNKIDVYVTAPTYTKITQDSNSSMEFPDSITLDKLDLELNGNSSVKINSMKVNQLGIDLSGNGAVKVKNLTANDADLDVSGNAAVKINFNQSNRVKLDVSGNAGIKLTGTTRQPIQQNVSGNAGITDNTTRIK